MPNGISKSIRKRQIWKKADGRCAHCGCRPSGMNRTVDHYIPRSMGGGYDKRNLLPLCRSCNEARKSRKVDPVTFYRYAKPWAICEAIEYESEFKKRT